MNTFCSFHPRLATLSLVSSLLIFAAQAPAQSFNCTNVLTGTNVTGGVSIVSGWPTNAAGYGTGGPVGVANQAWVGLSVQGFVATNTFADGNHPSSIIIQLIRSMSANPPAITYGTNALTGIANPNLLYSDWETWSNTAPIAAVTVPVASGWIGYLNWSTNLTEPFIGGANWLGVASIQTTSSNLYIGSFKVSLSKKIIPIRFP
jgi:hypothetical protein